MKPDWNFGPDTLARLAELADAGLLVQKIFQDHAQDDDVHGVRIIVETRTSYHHYSAPEPDYATYKGTGTTIHAAVADLWLKWKKAERKA